MTTCHTTVWYLDSRGKPLLWLWTREGCNCIQQQQTGCFIVLARIWICLMPTVTKTWNMYITYFNRRTGRLYCVDFACPLVSTDLLGWLFSQMYIYLIFSMYLFAAQLRSYLRHGNNCRYPSTFKIVLESWLMWSSFSCCGWTRLQSDDYPNS